MKPGGLLMFRDYGLYDLTMLRMSNKGGRLLASNNLWSRGDGTMAFFFTREYLEEIAKLTGFDIILNEYCCVKLKNR